MVPIKCCIAVREQAYSEKDRRSVLELQRNLFVLRRWWWLLVLGAIIGGIAAYGATKALAQNQYEAVAAVSAGAAPQGEQGTYFASSGPAPGGQLLTNQGVITGVQRLVPGISATTLAGTMKVTASQEDCVSLDTSPGVNQCELLSLHAQWPDPATAIELANAVATVFMQQERVRLKQGYALYHHAISAQEGALMKLVRATPGRGAAQNWLQAQYANTISGLSSNDADARVHASVAETSLQMAQRATSAVKVAGPKATVNGVLGALLGLLIAWLTAFLVTSSYGDVEEASGLQRVLSKIGD
jgi:capsular polysaccharide biosynthesis protein